jgi:hypothetical protein
VALHFLNAFGLILLTFHISAQAQILVFEPVDIDDPGHIQDVARIACPDSEQGSISDNCYLLQPQNLSAPMVLSTLRIQANRSNVVNMSFEVNLIPEWAAAMDYVYEDDEQPAIDRVKAKNAETNAFLSELESLMADNPQTLFISAAGNGVKLSHHYPLMTDGVGIQPGSDAPYPAVMQSSNLIKVTSTDKLPGYEGPVSDVRIAKYANFSLDFVDVAVHPAIVESPDLDEPKQGTSYAAPRLGEHTDMMMQNYPSLDGAITKEIVMKSCDVKNIDAAISASVPFDELEHSSSFWRAQYVRRQQLRLENLAIIGDILLVKSGGVYNRQIAESCAAIYSTGEFSVSEACLMAHQMVGGKPQQQLDKLTELWSARGL